MTCSADIENDHATPQNPKSARGEGGPVSGTPHASQGKKNRFGLYVRGRISEFLRDIFGQEHTRGKDPRKKEKGKQRS